MTKEEAIALVQRHLNRHQPPDYHLRVVETSVHQEDDWWYIGVGADREDIRRYDYYDRLAQVERELEDEEDAKISLMPPPSGAVER